MSRLVIPDKSKKIIKDVLKDFEEKKHLFETFANGVYTRLSSHPLLIPYIHFIKFRVKESSHLEDKLKRKAIEASENKVTFDINLSNVYEKIQDLAGVRIIHLNTKQVKEINESLLEIFNEQSYHKIEGPVANVWDIEYENYFSNLGMVINRRNSMYTSVHYIIAANTRDKVRCEIQVRTLMEEVWGEVSHKIDYPHKSKSIACQEQIKTLARVTSGGTRLVDSIFESHKEYNFLTKSKKKK